jgi:hypothetical protein
MSVEGFFTPPVEGFVIAARVFVIPRAGGETSGQIAAAVQPAQACPPAGARGYR